MTDSVEQEKPRKGGACFSPCRRYRYWLMRIWDDSLPMMAVIGANPSTADETADDPTIRKCRGFAQRLGFGGLLMLNVGAFRATDPKIWRDSADPFGRENTAEHLREYLARFKAELIVAAWGKCIGRFTPTANRLIEGLPDVKCWGRNGDGTPRHPLMLPYSTRLEDYPEAAND